MHLVETEYVCPYCSTNHLKNYSVLGDYNENGELLSFCPICGRMYKVRLSKNKRRIIAVRLAMRCNLNFKEAKEVTINAPKESFLKHIEKSLNILREDVLAVIENKKARK